MEGEPRMRQGDGSRGCMLAPCFGGRRLVSPTVSHKHAPNRRARINAQGRYPGTRYLALLRQVAGLRYPGPTCQTSIRWPLQLSMHATQQSFVRRVPQFRLFSDSHNSCLSQPTFGHRIPPIEAPSGRARVATFQSRPGTTRAC
jgi:hypothetical protein